MPLFKAMGTNINHQGQQEAVSMLFFANQIAIGAGTLSGVHA